MNYNPETVSTDYDVSDRLYFEELSLERVLDIYEQEQAWGLVVSVGGQIPQNLAKPLHDRGARVLGTSPDDIDRAEDRHKFSSLLDDLGVDQPPWRELQSVKDAQAFAAEVQYPVLVRPSFVLSGAAMKVATSDSELAAFLGDAADVSPDHPVVVSKFIRNAKEIEFDAVCRDGTIMNYAISEHVENAGVHSGDATLVLPAQKLYVQTQKQVKRAAAKIAEALNISGPVNIQFMARDNDVKVIECNLRASRSFPFISKTMNCNFISLATRVMLGQNARPFQITTMDIDYVCVKAAMFSFSRLRGADPITGVEMASTGEVACMGADVYEAYLYALEGSCVKIPTKKQADEGKTVFLSMHSPGNFAEEAAKLASLGFTLVGSPGTAKALRLRGVPIEDIPSSTASDWAPAAIELLKSGDVVFCINVPSSDKLNQMADDPSAETNGYRLRTGAIAFGVGLCTNEKCAALLVESLARKFAKPDGSYGVPRHLDEYYAGAF